MADPAYVRRQEFVHPVAFILAPSNSGKSFFVKSLGGREDVAVDGDAVIDATIGWPDGPITWWKDQGLNPRVQYSNWVALISYATARNVPILFNGGFWPRPNVWYGLVHIPDHEFERNAKLRDPRHPGADRDLFEANLLDLERMGHALAEQPGCSFRRFTSFASAVLAARKALPDQPPRLVPFPKNKEEAT